jgi:hypothetical protein
VACEGTQRLMNCSFGTARVGGVGCDYTHFPALRHFCVPWPKAEKNVQRQAYDCVRPAYYNAHGLTRCKPCSIVFAQAEPM